MKKDNLILISLLVIIIVIAVTCGYFGFKQTEEETLLTDALKIKEEYASLNEKVNEKNNKKYPIVNLQDNNPFVYKKEEEIVEILEKKTGVIYFGFKSCPWCRSMIGVLESAAYETNLNEIYYLDIENIRDVLSLDENEKVIKEKEGSSNYYKIIKFLEPKLRDYTLITKNNKSVSTNEKRLYAPTVVAVENGEIKGFHEVTVPTQKDGYQELNEKEKEELKKIYVDLINTISAGVCNEGC